MPWIIGEKVRDLKEGKESLGECKRPVPARRHRGDEC